MNWEEKLTAMQSLAGGRGLLQMVSPGRWACSPPGEIGGDGLLRSEAQLGSTPEEAVNAQWAAIMALPSDRYIQVSLGGRTRRYRWGGFMWVEQGGRS